MRNTLRKMGNPQGVIIAKPLLAQVEIEDEAVMTVENGALLLHPVRRSPRERWAEASRNEVVPQVRTVG
ncbi:MAG TPA: hypothetical protein VFQ95_07795 [Rhodanobacteraceae bacterium]|nr:hypothetical protein [Rhodanobacteraceae bacterium]